MVKQFFLLSGFEKFLMVHSIVDYNVVVYVHTSDSLIRCSHSNHT